MIHLVCGHPLPEGRPCWQGRDDHLHQPTCEDRGNVQSQYGGLLDDLASIAPVLSRRQRVALRKALVLP